MKIYILIVLLLLGLFFCPTICLAQSNDQKLGEMLNSSDFFTLKEKYPELENDSSEFMKLFSTSMISSLFNKPEVAIESINILLSDYQDILGFNNQISLITIMAENFIKTGDYHSACSLYEQLLNQVSQYLDEATISLYTDVLNKCESYGKIPKMIVDTATYIVPFKRDKMNLITAPIKVNGSEFDFVWDFGASTSMIDERYAQILGIEYIENSSHTILDGNSNSFQVKLGFVKELNIGDMTLYNIPFYVSSEPLVKNLPDNIDYEIKGIIGFPIFNQLQNMTFDMITGLLTINSQSESRIESNMIWFNNMLMVRGFCDNDIPIIMHFDSGNKETYVLHHFYQKNFTNEVPPEISTSHYVGASSIASYESFIHKDFKLAINTVDFLFENMTILSEYITSPLPIKIDARLGVDIFDKADIVIIDFENMSIEFITQVH